MMDGFKSRTPRRMPAPTREAGLSARAPQRPASLRQNNVAATQAQKPVSTSIAPDKSSPELPPIDVPVEKKVTASSRSLRKKWFFILLVIFFALIVGAVLAYSWYRSQLTPVDVSDTSRTDVTITSKTTYRYAMKSLQQKGLIRSELAATIYGYLSGKQSSLKEGTCRVAPNQSTPDIIDVLTKGCNEFRSITFFPGATIEQPLYKPEHAQIDQTMNIKNVLKKAGYTDVQISAALSKVYDTPLFAGKPAGSSLEGYIYGETYHVDPGASAEAVLEITFDQMYKDIQKYDLIKAYSAKGLDLFQGITLASIVQRELNCEGKPTEERREKCYQYQRTIAQVFLKRLKEDIQLGSDVTFIYAADQMKVQPRVDLDSPYNTRKYSGLPPGPIASPGVHALRAVGDPTSTDYVYFIAGDDGLIYFAKTEAEHEANIKNHCQKLCNEL